MKKEKKFSALEISVCVAMILSILLSSFFSIKSTTDEIKDNVLRFHIIANSDSREDQRVKMLVRDAVIGAGGELFSDCANKEDALKKAEDNRALFTETALRVLRENGFDYEVRTEIGKSRFPTRVYDDITLPAGEYNAVRVILGKGNGHNFWCVMFPPLCLSAAEGEKELSDVLSPEAEAFVKSGKRFEIRFKLVEWYENIKESIENKM